MALVRPIHSAEAARLLDLARTDRDAAREALATVPLEDQVALVCETPVARRAALLELVPHPEAVVPLLPEAELCFTVKAVGASHAGWLVEHATREQWVACVDLDAWSLQRFDPARFREWMLAAADAGDDTLEKLAVSIDPEALVLELRDRMIVVMKPDDQQEREEWQPPAGAQTLEGQFHYVSRRDGDDLAEITAMLRVLFDRHYWEYFRLMQGAIHELSLETEEWALRWRRGRLEDLGFPAREDAAALFARMEPDERTALPEAQPALDVSGWQVPEWFPKVTVARDAGPSLLAAAARLDEDEREAFLFRLLAVANKVAVAYDLPLSDVDSVPEAMDETVEIASRGLDLLVSEHGLAPEAVLRRTTLEHLFRVGVGFFPERAERVLSTLPPEDDDEAEDAGGDAPPE